MLPSYVNIRIAFKYIVDAMRHDEKNIDEIKKSVELTRLNILNARMDAIDAFINLAHYKFLLIEKRYRSADIFKVCPDYYSIKPEIDEINEFITSPMDFRKANIDRYEELRANYLPKMTKVYDLLNQAEQHALVDMKKENTVVGRINILNVLGFLESVSKVMRRERCGGREA
jgi:hypothetical protein